MKGQAAMEFLTTYAWGIVVVLIAIGALVYFGVLSPQENVYEQCDVWPEFSCDASKVNTNGTIQLQIRNNLPDLAFMTVRLTSNDCTLITGPQTQLNVQSTDRWNEYGNQLIHFDCSVPLRFQSIFEADINITYRERTEELEHTVIGFLRKKVE